MAQGNGKFGKTGSRKKSAGSQRRKTVKVAKKRNKGSSKVETKDKAIVAATKQINRKNERIIAAKATNAHTKFYLKDLTEKGAMGVLHFLVYSVVRATMFLLLLFFLPTNFTTPS